MQRLAVGPIGLWLWISVVLPLLMAPFPPAHGIQVVATLSMIILTCRVHDELVVLFPAFRDEAATVGNALADTRAAAGSSEGSADIVPVMARDALVVVVAASGDVSLISGRRSRQSFHGPCCSAWSAFLIHAAIAVTAARLYGWIGSQVKAARQADQLRRARIDRTVARVQTARC